MLLGPGWHSTTVDGEATPQLVPDLAPDLHPHPLVAAPDAPACCKAVADFQAEEGHAGDAVKAAVATLDPGVRLYLSPGDFH